MRQRSQFLRRADSSSHDAVRVSAAAMQTEGNDERCHTLARVGGMSDLEDEGGQDGAMAARLGTF